MWTAGTTSWVFEGSSPGLALGKPQRRQKGQTNSSTGGPMFRPYTKTGRLADVLALIQVLALDPDAHRSESGMTQELQGKPQSATEWFTLAKEHREFFRVAEREHGLSLVARHVLPKIGEQRPSLPPDFVGALLQTAITLHDREVAAAEWWKSWIPLASALAAALIASTTTLFTLWLSGWCKP
jgi:hypothetical protein